MQYTLPCCTRHRPSFASKRLDCACAVASLETAAECSPIALSNLNTSASVFPLTVDDCRVKLRHDLCSCDRDSQCAEEGNSVNAGYCPLHDCLSSRVSPCRVCCVFRNAHHSGTARDTIEVLNIPTSVLSHRLTASKLIKLHPRTIMSSSPQVAAKSSKPATELSASMTKHAPSGLTAGLTGRV